MISLAILDRLSPGQSLAIFLAIALAWILGLIYACVYLQPRKDR